MTDDQELTIHVMGIGTSALEEAVQEVWDFGPAPETGPEDLDTGEDILLLLARLMCLIPMQQARLQLMEIPERERTAQRKWLRSLEALVKDQGIRAGFRQHQLRKLGYSRKTTRIE